MAVFLSAGQAEASFSDLFKVKNNSDLAAAASKTYKLKVSLSGKGTVVSDDGKINCGSDCKETYSSSPTATIILTATPSSGYYFSGWSGGKCSGTGTCSVTMSKSITVKAKFKKDGTTSSSSSSSLSSSNSFSSAVSASAGVASYNLKVKKMGSGKVVSNPSGISCGGSDDNTCEALFSEGTSVILNTTSGGAGYIFGTWEGDCEDYNNKNPTCTLVMKRDMKVSATFNKNNSGMNVSVRTSGNGEGTVKNYTTNNTLFIYCGNDCSENLTENDINLTLIAYPSSGSVFGSWSGCDSYKDAQCMISGGSSGSRLITASFNDSDSKFKIEVKVNGSGAIASDDGKINCGSDCKESYKSSKSVKLTANPSDGYEFKYWKSCYEKSEGNVCTIKMDRERNIEAYFTALVSSGDSSSSANYGDSSSSSSVESDSSSSSSSVSNSSSLPVSAGRIISITTAATGITSTSATLNGTVNPQGNNVMHRFGYNLAGAAVPTYTAWSSTISGTTNAPVRANITGLTHGTTYYYFIQAYNSTTGSLAPNGLTESFTTTAAVTPITTAATSITSTSATLNGTVNPQGNNVMHRFGYNLAGAAVPTYTAWSLTTSGTTNLPARVSITGLSPGTAYYYFFQVYNSTTGSFAPNGWTESFTTSSSD